MSTTPVHQLSQKFRTNQGMQPVIRAAQKVMRPILHKVGTPMATLALDWPLIVGELLAQHTHPEALFFPKGQRTAGRLRVLVTGSFALEMPFHLPMVQERINSYFGYKAVESITLKRASVLPSRPKPYVSTAVYKDDPSCDPAYAAAYAQTDPALEPDLRAALAEMAVMLGATAPSAG